MCRKREHAQINIWYYMSHCIDGQSFNNVK